MRTKLGLPPVSLSELTGYSRYCLPWVIAFPVVGSAIAAHPAQAQSITAAADGTGSVVAQEDAHITITEGSLSADGANLFHSFETFSVTAGETASFVVDPAVQNVLARVDGHSPSIINGQLGIESAGQPNLFLMNPAGVLTGPDANLNLPANLTVTTADTIGFEQGEFSATEPNAYTALNGSPTGELTFNSAEPGSIVNQGEITVAPDAEITLVGGTVANTGSLSAPGGQITVAAVPGESTVHLNQPGSLLTLELTPFERAAETDNAIASITPLDLPTLLTYGDQTHANTLNANEDGSFSLTSEPGHILVSGSITTTDETAVGGNIAVLGEQVSVVEASLSASGPEGGGNISIGGGSRGESLLPAARETFVDAQTQISASALLSGPGGNIALWADDTTQYLGEIVALGGPQGGDGGFVEVSGKETLLFGGTVDTRSPRGTVGTLLLDPEDIVITDTAPAVDDGELLDGRILAGDGSRRLTISATALEDLANNSSVVLEATNNIFLENLADDALTFSAAAGGVTFAADADRNGAGSIIFRDSNDTLIAPGQSVNLSGKFLFLGNISTADPSGGGAVTLSASEAVRTGDIDTSASAGIGGNLSIFANSSIRTGTVRTQSAVQSGRFNATSNTNSITTEALFIGDNNNLNLSASQNISIQGMSLPEFLASNNQVTTPPIDPSETIEQNTLSALLSVLSATGSAGTLSDTLQASANTDSDTLSDGVQRTTLNEQEANVALATVEGNRHQSFSDYFGRELASGNMSLPQIQTLLADIEAESGNRSAVIYITSPEANSSEIGSSDVASVDYEISLDGTSKSQPDQALELLLFLAEGAPIQVSMPAVEQQTLLDTVTTFRSDIVTSARRGGDYYLSSAQQLYQWLIEPLIADLNAANIDTLIFSMDEGLRALPVAALHDGDSFLVEQYSLGVAPSLGMIDSQYVPLASAQVLAMGVSDFDRYEQFNALPGVPLEIDAINDIWPGIGLLNEQFTRPALVAQRQQTPYQVVHLATHAEMNAGDIDRSFIQLWDEQLLLSDLHQLGLSSPAVNLLVLSACNTALDSAEAEMGFAGLAIAAGVDSALASLWAVNDLGTLALMNDFYQQLQTSPTKAEALQQAQLAMLQGNIHIEEQQLSSDRTPNSSISLSSGLGLYGASDLSHPYYWAGFTLVGSPW